MKISLTIIFLIICPVMSFAWNDTETHPTLSEYAAERVLGTDFMEETVKGLKVRKLIREGSEREDDWPWYWPPSARSGNHFHAPNRPLDRAGWRETSGMSTPLWAQDGTEQAKFFGGDWSWGRVRGHLYNYVTATSKQAEDDNLVNMLKGLGYQMHLVQDMSQPNHVRDDTHIPDGFGWKWIVNGFETWAKDNDIKIIRNQILDKKDELGNNLFPIPNTQVDLTKLFNNDQSKVPVARLSDTREHLTEIASENGKPTYSIVPSTSLSQGLAEYTNANFFSENTAFAADRYALTDTRHQFPYPRKSETNLQDFIASYLDPVMHTDVDGKSYLTFQISKQNTTGEHLNCLTVPGPNTLKFYQEYGGEGGMFYGSFRLNEDCMREYAEKLIPRTVGYSTAMLDYFFRGELTVTVPADTPPTGNHIRLNVRNSTPTGEAMTGGSIELMVIFREYKKSGTASTGTLVPEEEFTFRKYTYDSCSRENPVCTIDSTDRAFDFDLSANPLPPLARDMSLVVVYRGKLGSEPDSVAYEQIYPDNFTGDLNLSLPARGVYASTNNPDALSATFNDFALAATNGSTTTVADSGNTELLVLYRQAAEDPFKNNELTIPETIHYASVPIVNTQGIPSSAKREMQFSLADALIPATATDVYLYLIHTNSDGTILHGFRDISEPTPIDVFNNADKVCVNGTWYSAGAPATLELLDGSGNLIADQTDLYAHNIANIFAKVSATGSATMASAANFTLNSAATLAGGNYRRLGYILSDYSFKYSILEDWLDVDPSDPWITTEPAEMYSGTAVKNQDGEYPYMFTIRGKQIWWGAGVVYDNDAWPVGTTADDACHWSLLP